MQFSLEQPLPSLVTINWECFVDVEGTKDVKRVIILLAITGQFKLLSGQSY